MPRPKPPQELKPRGVRMTDEEWAAFRAIGGIDWLRRLMNTRPARYYEVFQRVTKESA